MMMMIVHLWPILLTRVYTRLDELLRYRNREEVVQTLIKINRVKCMLETYALRKKFLRWRQRDRRKSIRLPFFRAMTGMMLMLSYLFVSC